MNVVTLLLAATISGADSIDSILTQEWARRGIKPTEVCSDEQFVRRATLDLIGRIPTVEEVQSFRQNPDRSEKIDELLASDEFPRFWSEVWAATLSGYANAFESDREVLRLWLEKATRDNMPYDKQVVRLITARGVSALDGPTNFLIRYPEEPAVKVSRLFLGVRLDCARCHDHPFDRWTEEDFALMNRFFDATERQEVTEGNVRLVDRRPEVDDDDRPRFLTGARPQTTQWRDELALFITNSKPFARAYVNRLWYHFMGRGIVHPVDDFNRENPASVPALMSFLSSAVREKHFAIRPMIRMICNSQVYQLSSSTEARNPDRKAVFAYHQLKPLTPEQAYDSVAVALGLKRRFEERREFIERMVSQSLDEDFSNTWEYRETVQDLMGRLSLNISAPTEAVDDLYTRILSRSPTAEERRICQKQRPQDIAFALLNSNEFFFNH